MEKWRQAIDDDIKADNIPAIIDGVIAIAMHEKDALYAEKLCVRLAEHQNADVRATALLGFGHIARVHRSLKSASVKALIERGLKSGHALEQAHARAARSDIQHF